MIKKIILSISIIALLIIFFFYFKSPDQKDINENVDIIPETSSPTSNMIENVENDVILNKGLLSESVTPEIGANFRRFFER